MVLRISFLLHLRICHYIFAMSLTHFAFSAQAGHHFELRPCLRGQCEATALLATTEHSCSQRSLEGLCHVVTEGRECSLRRSQQNLSITKLCFVILTTVGEEESLLLQVLESLKRSTLHSKLIIRFILAPHRFAEGPSGLL